MPSSFSALRPLGPQSDVDADKIGNQYTPQSIGLADGRFLLTWFDERSMSIHARFIAADGAPQGLPFQIKSPDGSTATDSYAVAQAPDGTIWLTALVYDLNDDLYRTALTAFNPSLPRADIAKPDWRLMDANTSNHQLFPTIEILSNGNAVVSWVELPDGSTVDDLTLAMTGNQRAQIMTSPTTTSSGMFSVNNLKFGASMMSNDILAFDDGRFMVVWNGAQPGGNEIAVMGQLFSSTGIKIGTQISLSEESTSLASNGSVALLSDGNIVVVWQTPSYETEGMIDVMARIVTPNGDALTNAFVVHEGVDGIQRDPAVMALSDSRFIISWTDESGTVGDPSTGVVGRMFLLDTAADRFADNMAISSVFQINTILPGDQEIPALAVSRNRLLVAWDDSFLTGASRTGDDIAYRMFDTSPMRLSETKPAEETRDIDYGHLRTPSITLWNGVQISGADSVVLSDGRIALVTTSSDLIREVHIYNPKTQTADMIAVGRHPEDNYESVWLDEIVPTPSGGFLLFYENSVREDYTYNGVHYAHELIYLTQQEYNSEGLQVDEPQHIRYVGSTGLGYHREPLTDLYAELFEGGYRLHTLSTWRYYDSGVETFWFARDENTARPSLKGTERADVIEGLAGNDRIFGFGGNDIIRGRGGNDQLFGGSGNDILDGGVGADRMIGGIGNDTFVVGQLRDRVEELANGGNDLVRSSISWTLTKHVEGLELTGAAHLHGTGNGTANTITGNTGRNVLKGLDGNDKLFGRAGNDSLYGGSGNDTLFGGAGNDLLNGGSGAERMIGGGGNDIYLVGQARDRVEELANGGNDLVRSSISWTLAKHVERLELTGAAHLQGTGNGASDTLTGNAGRNTLRGLDGNDKLYGGAGMDTLFGGTGNDTLVGGAGRDVLHGGAGRDQFVFFFAEHSGTTANTRDLITTFVSGQNRINILAIDADTTRRGNQAFLFDEDKMSANASLDRGHVGWHQADRVGTANDRTIVRFNTDNDRNYEMTIEIQGLINLDASDFLL